MNSRKTLIYLHIPKCAGTSVRDWLFGRFSEDEVFWHNSKTKLKDERVANLAKRKLVIGHIKPYHRKLLGLELKLGRANLLYAACVRNPLDQVASHLNYVLKDPTHPDYFEMPIQTAISRDTRFFRRQRNLQCSYF